MHSTAIECSTVGYRAVFDLLVGEQVHVLAAEAVRVVEPGAPVALLVARQAQVVAVAAPVVIARPALQRPPQVLRVRPANRGATSLHNTSVHYIT